MEKYTNTVYDQQGGKFTSKHYWSIESYLKDISHSDDIEELDFIETIKDHITNVYNGNVRIATIHKYPTPTIESICKLLGMSFDEWVKKDQINKLRFADEVAFEFCDKFRGTDVIFDDIVERVKVLKGSQPNVT